MPQTPNSQYGLLLVVTPGSHPGHTMSTRCPRRRKQGMHRMHTQARPPPRLAAAGGHLLKIVDTGIPVYTLTHNSHLFRDDSYAGAGPLLK